MAIKMQVPLRSNASDEELMFIREMGIRYINMNVSPEECTAEALDALQQRVNSFDLAMSDVACPPLQKNPAIDLGWPEKDAEIEKFAALVRAAGQVGIPIVSVAWQPNGILRTGWAPGQHTRGGISAYADMEEILARPNANDRSYTAEEIWDNFAYFLRKIVPVCEESGVRMALHPNDPPAACLAGVASLVYDSDCYRRAFALADSPALGMKLCVGCWLEAGEAFGNLMQDIAEFCKDDRILCVHFRNVSAQMPYFEETLAEDGYADMYAIMKQFVKCGYHGVMSIDHAFKGQKTVGGMLGATAYPTGYMKGLYHAALLELGTPWGKHTAEE